MAVNVLKNGPKILRITKKGFLQLNFISVNQ